MKTESEEVIEAFGKRMTHGVWNAKKQYCNAMARLVGTEILTRIAHALADAKPFDVNGRLTSAGQQQLAEVAAQAGKQVFEGSWLTADIVVEFAQQPITATTNKG
jgi:hypothetical protein